MSDNSRKVPPPSSEAAGSGNSDDPVPDGSQEPTASQPTSQEDSPSSQNKSDRIWKLKKMGFRILEFASTVPGKPMNIKMEFTLKDGTKKTVDLPYTNEAMKGSRRACVNRIGKGIWLDKLPSHFQDKYFPDFIDQQLVAFDEQNDPDLGPRKKILEFDKPKIKKHDDKYYWVAGPSEIHLLTYYRSESENYFSKKLSDEEIQELPFDVIYTGQTTKSYSNDEEEAFKIILSIIDEMNAMQEPEWYSFSLVSLSQNLGAEVYEPVLEEQKTFSSTVVLSGSGNTARTGKSLMTSTWQNAMEEEEGPRKQHMKISESTLFDELDKGQIVHLREWNKDTSKIMNLVIPMVWEGLGRTVKKVDQKVRSVMFVDANLDPDDLNLHGANISKVVFVASGSTALKHAKRMEKCGLIISLSKKLNKFKPVLLGLALNCMLKRITDDQLDDYECILTDRDDRLGQVILNYDRLHGVLEEAIEKYQLVRPPLFKLNFIDRHSLLRYNQRQDELTPYQMAEKVAEFILEGDLKESIESHDKSQSFKIKLNLATLTPAVSSALKNTSKETCTSFMGKAKVKVRILSQDLLSESTVKQLKALKETFDLGDWLDIALDRVDSDNHDLGLGMYVETIGLSKKPTKRKNLDEVEDEFESETEPGQTIQPAPKVLKVHAKMYTCLVESCPSRYHNFRTPSGFKKHLMTQVHKSAEKAEFK